MKDVNILINNGANVKKALELFGDMETYDATLETFLQEVSLVFYEDIGYNVEINKPILTLEMSRGLFFDFTKMVTRLFDFLGFADQDWVVI